MAHSRSAGSRDQERPHCWHAAKRHARETSRLEDRGIRPTPEVSIRRSATRFAGSTLTFWRRRRIGTDSRYSMAGAGNPNTGCTTKVSQSAGEYAADRRTAKDAFGDGSPDELLEACCRELVETRRFRRSTDAIHRRGPGHGTGVLPDVLPSAPAAETTDLGVRRGTESDESLGTEPEERVRRRRQRRAERRFEEPSRWYPEEARSCGGPTERPFGADARPRSEWSNEAGAVLQLSPTQDGWKISGTTS